MKGVGVGDFQGSISVLLLLFLNLLIILYFAFFFSFLFSNIMHQDLPQPGIESVTPALVGGLLTIEPSGKPTPTSTTIYILRHTPTHTPAAI